MAARRTELDTHSNVDQDGIDHDELMRFLGELRAEGFAVGVGECIDVFAAARYAQTISPGSHDTLRQVLAPVLCTTPDQQDEFNERFNAWLKTTPDAESTAPRERSKHEQLIENRRRLGLRAALAFAAVALAAVVAGALLLRPDAPPALACSNAESDPSSVTASVRSKDGTIEVVGCDNGTLLLRTGDGEATDLALEGHSAEVASISLSPDATSIASTSTDGTAILLWNSANGDARGTIEDKDERSAFAAVLYTPDGSTLVTTSVKGTVRLWDAETGNASGGPFAADGPAATVTFSPDARTMAFAGANDGIGIVDADSGQLVKTLTGHSDSVSALTYSPNGEMLASGSLDTAVIVWNTSDYTQKHRLDNQGNAVSSVAFEPGEPPTLVALSEENVQRRWNVATGRPIDADSEVCAPPDECLTLPARSVETRLRVVDAVGQPVPDVSVDVASHSLLAGHSDAVRSVAFSPDGQTLASGGRDNTIRLWDAGTGQLRATLTGHTAAVYSVAFSPDGQTLASGSWDATIRLWDAGTGQLRATLTGHTAGVNSVAFSSDGRTLASGGRDDAIRLWDADTGRLHATFTGHTEGVVSVAFSPDGQTLASGSWDATIRLWDAGTGQPRATLTEHTLGVHSVAFSPDGQTLASGSSDETIRLWDAATGRLRATLGHSAGLWSIAFSPDSQTLAAGSSDRIIGLWDTGTGRLRATLTGHTEGVVSVAFSPDGRKIASGSSDATVGLWESDPGQGASTLGEHTSWVKSSTFSPDGQTLATASGDKTIRLWDIVTAQVRLTLTGHTEGVTSVAFSPDSRTLASGSRDNTVRLWDASAGEVSNTLAGHTERVTSVAFSPDGKTLASGSWDDSVRLWNITTGEALMTLDGHSDQVWSVAFSPDGQRLVSGSSDSTIRVWDVGTGQLRTTLTGHTGAVYSVAFSPDGVWLASGGGDNAIQLWDPYVGLQVTLTGHNDQVWSVAFSPDGQTLVSGSQDTSIRLWDISPENRIARSRFRAIRTGHTKAVLSVAVSPDGETIASSGDDRTLRLWQLNSHATQRRKTNADGEVLMPRSSGPRTANIDEQQFIIAGAAEDSDTSVASTYDHIVLLEMAAPRPFYDGLRDHVRALQALMAALFAAGLGTWLWLRRRRAEVVVEMRQAASNTASRRVNIARPRFELYGGARLMQAAANARLRQSLGRGELNVDATVRATINRLGMPTPIYHERLEMPVYLALVDRRGPGDQAADRVDELLDRLEATGVALERFDFDQTPAMFRPRGGGRYRDLRELTSIFRRCRVLLFSDGSGLMHPLTGQLRSFASSYDTWQDCALLTPLPVQHWGQREMDIAGAGFVVMPASLDGFAAFVAQANSPDSSVGVDDPWRPQYPPLLQSREAHWLSEDPPADERIEALCEQLRNYLGGRTYRWLCALAVYPELNWHLTIYLGLHLTRADGTALLDETALMDLTRLPWLRRGKMPTWLRVTLLGQLAKPDELKVRTLLRNLMEHQLTGADTFSLEVAQSTADEERSWRRTLRDVFRSAPQSNVTHDQVYVGFLFGRSAQALQLKAPDGWRRFVYERGLGQLGLRPTFVSLLVAAGLGAMLFGMETVADHVPHRERSSELWTINSRHYMPESDASRDWVATPPPPDLKARLTSEPLISDAATRVVSDDLARLVTTDGTRWARLWDTSGPRLLATVEHPVDERISRVDIATEGSRFRSYGETTTAQWSYPPVVSDSVVRTVSGDPEPCPALTDFFSPDVPSEPLRDFLAQLRTSNVTAPCRETIDRQISGLSIIITASHSALAAVDDPSVSLDEKIARFEMWFELLQEIRGIRPELGAGDYVPTLERLRRQAAVQEVYVPTPIILADIVGANAPGDELQAGHIRMTAPNMTGDTQNGEFAAVARSGPVSVRAFASGEWRDRGEHPRRQSKPGLVRDHISSTNASSGAPELTITISGLDAGSYDITTYHVDWHVASNINKFDVRVSDALGPGRLVRDAFEIPADIDYPGQTYCVKASRRGDVVITLRDVEGGKVVFNGIEVYTRQTDCVR